jgi:hypothetical protein
LVVISAFAGCGDKGRLAGLYKCEGSVTYKGEPVVGGVLTFYPDGGNPEARPASANTDAQGRFKVTTLKENDGIFPGNYTVTIEKFEQYGQPRKVKDGEGNIVEEYNTRNILPVKYADPKKSGLTVTIEKKKNVLPTFELVD